MGDVQATAVVNAPGMAITLKLPNQVSPDQVMSGDEALKFTWDKREQAVKKQNEKLARKWFDTHLKVLEAILDARENKQRGPHP
jgi:hypothetical protein